MVAPPLSFAGIPWKIPHVNGQKLALITNGAIGLPKTKPDSDPIKKGKPNYPICIKFFRRPAGRALKPSFGRPSSNLQIGNIAQQLHFVRSLKAFKSFSI